MYIDIVCLIGNILILESGFQKKESTGLNPLTLTLKKSRDRPPVYKSSHIMFICNMWNA